MENNKHGISGLTYDVVKNRYIINPPLNRKSANLRRYRNKYRRRIRRAAGMDENADINILYRGIDDTPRKRITAEELIEQGKLINMEQLDIWFPEYTNQFVALDCEMVGAGEKKQSKLARVSITDWGGNVMLNLYVNVQNVTDMQTKYSGITKQELEKGVSEEEAIKSLKNTIKNKIIIGHDLKHDFKVLQIQPDKSDIRDTATYPPLQKNNGGIDKFGKQLMNFQPRKLKELMESYYPCDTKQKEKNEEYLKSGHCSIEDSKNAMKVFHLFHATWGCAYSDFLRVTANESSLRLH